MQLSDFLVIIHTNARAFVFVNYDLVNIEVPYTCTGNMMFSFSSDKHEFLKKSLDEVHWKSSPHMTAIMLLTLVLTR